MRKLQFFDSLVGARRILGVVYHLRRAFFSGAFLTHVFRIFKRFRQKQRYSMNENRALGQGTPPSPGSTAASNTPVQITAYKAGDLMSLPHIHGISCAGRRPKHAHYEETSCRSRYNLRSSSTGRQPRGEFDGNDASSLLVDPGIIMS